MLYDPTQKLDQEAWLALSIGQRQEQAEAYHVAPGAWHPPVVNPPRHAMLHVVVESQIARGADAPAQAKLQQLARQGLHRHEAIHALASAYLEHADAVAHGRAEMDDVPRDALARLSRLTASSWSRGQATATDSQGRRKPAKRRPKPRRARDRKKKKKKRK